MDVFYLPFHVINPSKHVQPNTIPHAHLAHHKRGEGEGVVEGAGSVLSKVHGIPQVTLSGPQDVRIENDVLLQPRPCSRTNTEISEQT